MLNTSEQTKILHDLTADYFGDVYFDEFFVINDIGAPLAFMAVEGFCTITDQGQEMILDSYSNLCELLEVDRHGEYAGVDAMVELSKYGEQSAEG